MIQSAIGGMNITTTVEGLERYPVNLRYSRELRDNLPALESVLVPTPTGQQIPLGQLAACRYAWGRRRSRAKTPGPTPGSTWISAASTSALTSRTPEGGGREDQAAAGYTLIWSGQYEYMQRAKQRLMYVIPLTIADHFRDHLPEHRSR